ncbi:glycosyltransferase family 4 protein [Candidatus Woesearchaeota archaeon]|nr:glycosyltransferase family 4 protein [Candidatus Woesearchaeota archaeon]
MNIAFLTKEYHPSTVDAGFTTLLNLAKEFKRQGNTVVMISGREKYTQHKNILPAKKRFELVEGIPIFRPYKFPQFKTNVWILNPSLFFNRFFAAPAGLRYVQKRLNLKFDIIHSFSSAPILVLNNILAKSFSKNAKKVHTIKSSSVFDNFSFKLLNLSDAVISSLELLKKEFIKKGCEKNKITIINSPIYIKNFRKKNKTGLRKKYGFNKKDKLILYYGNRVHSKGTDIILNCIDYLPKNKNITILMIHPTVWPKEYTEYLKKKKNRTIIKLMVKKINVADYLSMANAVIFPYRNLQATEANPLCLLEAMACKTPIVTTSIPEINELVTDYKDVLMALPNNPKSLAEKILEMINNPELQRKLTKNAYKTVKKFDVSIIAKKHLELYKKLLKKDV